MLFGTKDPWITPICLMIKVAVSQNLVRTPSSDASPTLSVVLCGECLPPTCRWTGRLGSDHRGCWFMLRYLHVYVLVPLCPVLAMMKVAPEPCASACCTGMATPSL